jgi:hypothetical protein
MNLFLDCVRKSWEQLQQETGRRLEWKHFKKCVELCYSDAFEFENKLYKPQRGSQTGHPISSCAQNVVMTCLEKEVIQPMLESGDVKLYNRWVDDTKMRMDRDQVELLREKLNRFSPNFKFTVEEPTEVELNGNVYNFLPFLDIGVYWRNGECLTKVYRKATTSHIVIPFNEFAPMDWKNGTLIFFIRRAISHCSTFHAMHDELQLVTQQFRDCGYPAGLRWSPGSIEFSTNSIDEPMVFLQKMQ